MSALILVSHVKNGVEKAREYRLGEPIIDIIKQHHGTGLIKFFYYKAVRRQIKPPSCRGRKISISGAATGQQRSRIGNVGGHSGGGV